MMPWNKLDTWNNLIVNYISKLISALFEKIVLGPNFNFSFSRKTLDQFENVNVIRSSTAQMNKNVTDTFM